jgi:hypothetical protein
MMILAPKTESHEWDAGLHQVDVRKQDGSFEISEVTPGSYVLTTIWFDEGKIYSTTLPIDVGRADVEGISVTIGPGVDISGQVVWEGKPSLDRDELTVSAVPVDLDFVSRGGARVSQTNSFTLKNVGDGTYHVEVEGESKDCYIKDARYAGSSVLEEGLMVARGTPASIEITISSNGAKVQGAVSDADRSCVRSMGRARAQRTSPQSTSFVQNAKDRSIWAFRFKRGCTGRVHVVQLG